MTNYIHKSPNSSGWENLVLDISVGERKGIQGGIWQIEQENPKIANQYLSGKTRGQFQSGRGFTHLNSEWTQGLTTERSEGAGTEPSHSTCNTDASGLPSRRAHHPIPISINCYKRNQNWQVIQKEKGGRGTVPRNIRKQATIFLHHVRQRKRKLCEIRKAIQNMQEKSFHKRVSNKKYWGQIMVSKMRIRTRKNKTEKKQTWLQIRSKWMYYFKTS